MREPISIDLRNAVLKRDRWSCRYCGKRNVSFHMDHVYPVAKGGETSFDNLATSCPRCNTKKHTNLIWPKPVGYFENKPNDLIHKALVDTFIGFISLLFLVLGVSNLMIGDVKIGTTEILCSAIIIFPVFLQCLYETSKTWKG